MFNMQSGSRRQQFPPRKSSKRGGLHGEKHTKGVSGLMIDALNQTVVSSGLDGKIKVALPLLM